MLSLLQKREGARLRTNPVYHSFVHQSPVNIDGRTWIQPQIAHAVPFVRTRPVPGVLPVRFKAQRRRKGEREKRVTTKGQSYSIIDGHSELAGLSPVRRGRREGKRGLEKGER